MNESPTPMRCIAPMFWIKQNPKQKKGFCSEVKKAEAKKNQRGKKKGNSSSN